MKYEYEALDCCNCCARVISNGSGFRDADGKIYCNEEHAKVNRRYLRQCKKAIDEAKKYPAHQVDYQIAQFYLSAKLKQFAANQSV